MLTPLHFVPRSAGYATPVLGVLISQASAVQPTHFSVPAHTFATLNVVLDGTLSLGQQRLSLSFATGSHTRSRRYVISPGAVLLTLFCRAEILAQAGQDAKRFTDRYLPATVLFPAWAGPESFNIHPLSVAQTMLDCVAPAHLAISATVWDQQARALLDQALIRLLDQDLAGVAQQLGLSLRSLQRLFSRYWGVSPKLVQRLLRLQRCIAQWDQQALSLADLAIQVGLSDQAHLAREFRQLVGYAPSHLKTSATATNDTLWALRTGGQLLDLMLPDTCRFFPRHSILPSLS